jgi:hypothetical protein
MVAVLFPVFRRTVETAKAASCASNFHQAGLATMLYTADYEDRFMPVSAQLDIASNSRTDRTWVQVVLPYTRNFKVFHCPANPTSVQADESMFDQDLVPGDTYSEFYTASLHVNTGYNYQYLAPILLENGRWQSHPRTDNDVREPSRTLLFVDSKWPLPSVDTGSGGSWLVVPPCRYASQPDGQLLDTFLGGQKAEAAFVLTTGWSLNGNSTEQYGGAWPWHIGRMTIAHVDGSVRSMSPKELSVGCDVQADFSGPISNPDAYLWDIR